ncbi:hypothetical protein CCHL11_03263 [Colletotrichum chlorophyti]|uniref:Uncharacterized protein n=1 Tax=Colletotrichum chlorophyti TaxID=708187 RepID=A0A1Q8S406_9PEZI|nr:hypothetical protein CCHL11_03263 [Colletotrichum chlorophyti]
MPLQSSKWPNAYEPNTETPASYPAPLASAMWIHYPSIGGEAVEVVWRQPGRPLPTNAAVPLSHGRPEQQTLHQHRQHGLFQHLGLQHQLRGLQVGLLTFYERLKHVYGAPAVRATVVHSAWVRTPVIEKLVETGKLREPTVLAADVAGVVVNQIFTGYGAQICVLSSLGWTSMVRGIPVWLQEGLRDSTMRGLLDAMEQSS